LATHPYRVLRRPRRYAFEAMGTNAGAWKDNARSQCEAESAMGERVASNGAYEAYTGNHTGHKGDRTP
jgi:hypothetical protein